MPQDYKPGHIDPFWSPEDKAAMTRVNGELSNRAASAAARESRGRQMPKDWLKRAEPPRALKKAPPPRRDPERSK